MRDKAVCAKLPAAASFSSGIADMNVRSALYGRPPSASARDRWQRIGATGGHEPSFNHVDTPPTSGRFNAEALASRCGGELRGSGGAAGRRACIVPQPAPRARPTRWSRAWQQLTADHPRSRRPCGSVRRSEPVSAIHPLPGDHGPKDPGVAHLLGGHGKHVAVHQREVRRLSRLD
jgi:hypothetical protein